MKNSNKKVLPNYHWLAYLVNKRSFVCEKQTSPSSFSSLFLSLIFFVGLFLSSCGSGSTPTPTPPTPPTPNNEVALSITSVKIGDKVVNLPAKPTDISLTPVVILVFSQDMPVATLKSANKVTLKQGTTDVAYTITQGTNNKTITITPNKALLLATDYTLTIAKDLTVQIGEITYKLAEAIELTFKTTNEGVLNIETIQIDDTTIDLSTKPTNIALLPTITLVFSQNITADELINSSKVTLKKGVENILFTITQGVNAKTITIKPSTSLNKSTDYTLTIIKDLSVTIGELSYNLTENVVFEFATIAQNTLANLTALTLTIGETDVVGTIESTNVKFSVLNKAITTGTVKLITISDYATSNNIDDVLTFTDSSSTLTVTAEDGTTVATYTLQLVSNQAKITGITLTIGGANYQTTFTETSTTANMPVNNDNAESATIKAVAGLSTGAVLNPVIDAAVTFTNKQTTLTITAEDGTTTQIYTIALQNEDLKLTTLTLSIATELKIEGTNIYVPVADKTVVTEATITNITIATGASSNPATSGTLNFSDSNGVKTATITVSKEGASQPYTVILQNNTNSITTFTFLAEGNTGIDTDVIGTVRDSTDTNTGDISVTLFAIPSLTSLSLVPNIEKNAQSILPVTGEAQDFSTAVTYSVTSEYGITRTYTVRVTADPIYTFVLGEGGSITGESPLTVARGTIASIPIPTRTHYRFVGWFTNTEQTTAFTPITVSADIVLYAKWVRQYRITYDAGTDGALPTGVTSPQSKDSDIIVVPSALPTPIKTNHRFIGWFTDATKKIPYASVMLTEDITLYAKWIAQHRVTFDLDEGAFPVGTPNPKIVDTNARLYFMLPLPTPIKTNHRFIGWFTDEAKMRHYAPTRLDRAPILITADIVLYAKWIVQHRVIFDLNYVGSIGTPQAQILDSGATAKRPSNPIRASYYFAGWFETNNPSDSETVFVFTTPIIATKTLYAKWVQTGIKVSFNTDGGSAVSSQEIVANGFATRPDIFPTKDNYYFMGWFTENESTTNFQTTRFNFETTAITVATTIYGKFEVIITPTDKAALQTAVNAGITKYGNSVDLNYINTRNITDMSRLFRFKANFNGNVSKWDVSNVTNMSRTFQESAFNQPLNNWDVSKVTDMSVMFLSTSFNYPLNNWDVSNVTNMSNMFNSNSVFNQDLTSWDVSSVTNNADILTESVEERNIPIFKYWLLPINFETIYLSYEIEDFEGGVSERIDNPYKTGINTTDKVVKFTKSRGIQTAAGTGIFVTTIDFSTKTTFKVKIYSPKTGVKVRLRVESIYDSSKNAVKEATTTTKNAWEELSFDFSTIDKTVKYAKLLLYFDYGAAGDNSVYYFDAISLTD